MWLRQFTSFLLENRWRALLLTFLITFVPLLGIGVSILIAAFMTLRKGFVEGALFTAAATIPIAIAFLMLGNKLDTNQLMIWIELGVAIISNILTWAFAVMLFRQSSWSDVIQIAALMGVLVISVIHLAYPDVADWWGVELLASAKQTPSSADQVLKALGVNIVQMRVDAVSITKYYATGSMVAIVLLVSLTQLVVARWWESVIFSPGRTRRELHNLRLSRLAGVLFLFALALTYYGNEVALDIMPVLYVLFGAVGLSLVHYLFGLMNSKVVLFWLVLFYTVLILTSFGLLGPGGVFLIAVLALCDVWLDFRKRFRKI